VQQYISQLLTDINEATQNLTRLFVQTEAVSLQDWLSPEEEDATAPVRNLPEWLGITPEMLPPANMLKEDELHQLIDALKKMLAACNCHVVFQIEVPEVFQYEAIRQNLNQDVKVRQWHMGFFEFCKPNTELKTCALGEHCQCAFYAELFTNQIGEDLAPEEERARSLEIEVGHIRKKYDDDWMKYYPYHLDKDYDDENGNPYDYGIGDDEEEDDTWWR
jgi:hypothetical protein